MSAAKSSNRYAKERALVVRFLLPLATIALSWGVACAAAVSQHLSPFAPETWVRWDSHLYIQIAEKGYLFFRCPPNLGGPGYWCGNTSWFPAYPLLMDAVHLLGVPYDTGGAILSWTFFYLCLVLIGALLADALPLRQRVMVLAAAAFFPGHTYFYAVFPMSMAAAFVLGLIYFARRGQDGAAGMAGAMANFSHSMCIGTVPFLALWSWWFARPATLRAKRRRLVTYVVAPVLGYLAVFLFESFFVGRWDAYYLGLVPYHHHPQNPLMVLWLLSGPLWDVGAWSILTFNSWQILVVAGFAVAMMAVAVAAIRSREYQDLLPAGLALAMWALPVVMGPLLSHQRNCSMMLPGVLLLPRLPRAAQWLFLGLFIMCAWPMDVVFFQGKLP